MINISVDFHSNQVVKYYCDYFLSQADTSRKAIYYKSHEDKISLHWDSKARFHMLFYNSLSSYISL